MRLSAALLLAVYCAPVEACEQITSVPWTITQPGYYCLASDLGYPNNAGAAVSIQADSVTVDLKGYRLWTPSGLSTSAIGIEAPAGRLRTTIRNGSVDGFKYGVLLRGQTIGALVEDLRVAWSTLIGIQVGHGGPNTVRNCIVDQTGWTTTDAPFTAGIWVTSSQSIVKDNTVSSVYPPSSGGGTAYGIIGGGLGAHSGNTALLLSGVGTCFSFGLQDVYRNLTAQGCLTAFAGGINGGGNFP